MSGSTDTAAQRFLRAEHVRRHADFERIYASGSRIQARYMTVFVAPNGGRVARFGVAATRKLGPAVDRNRAKRLAREVFRRHKLEEGLDVVVVPRREMLDALFTSLEADYRGALESRHRASPASRRPRRHGAARPRFARIKWSSLLICRRRAGSRRPAPTTRPRRFVHTAPSGVRGSRRAGLPGAARGVVTASIRSRSGS
jgi:ribonuclease P protein component